KRKCSVTESVLLGKEVNFFSAPFTPSTMAGAKRKCFLGGTSRFLVSAFLLFRSWVWTFCRELKRVLQDALDKGDTWLSWRKCFVYLSEDDIREMSSGVWFVRGSEKFKMK
ncbi:hypothetical protein CEXT_668741, partial [Caerostris extrusa]